ncbi:MAG: hypothetical protein ACE5FT_00940 [Candidatus Nanoarchaeia archaeon]
MEKYLWEILVPDYDNEKNQYDLEHHHEWDDYVRNIAGGLTIFKTGKGQWVSPEGELFKDVMIPVRIQCTIEEIIDIGRFTVRHYTQKAVMFYRVGDLVEIIHEHELDD